MGAPLEKVHNLLGQRMRLMQVFDPSRVGSVASDAFYFMQLPVEPNAGLSKASQELRDALPFYIPIQVADWYFISRQGHTWEEHLSRLKVSHAKKIRRYLKKTSKYGYTVKPEGSKTLSQETLLRCYDLLRQTMRRNGDHDFYTKDSFFAHMRSLAEGVFIARRNDGFVLGFYSGAVIGHDHSTEFKCWAVYHNLFIEYARREFSKGIAMIDLGNTNGAFKQELGGKDTTVVFELHANASLHSCICLAAWAINSMIPDDNYLCRAIKTQKFGMCSLVVACVTLILSTVLLKPQWYARSLDIVLLGGFILMMCSRLR